MSVTEKILKNWFTFFVLSRELLIIDLKLTNLSHKSIGKSYPMEKALKGIKYFTVLSYQVKSHKSSVLTAQMQ